MKGPDGSVRHFSSKTKIWAAGVLALPLAKMFADATGAQRDRAGRIKVEPDCSLPGHSEVFVVGDMMNYNDLPGVAEVALQSGSMPPVSSKTASETVLSRLPGSTGTLEAWPPWTVAALSLARTG